MTATETGTHEGGSKIYMNYYVYLRGWTDDGDLPNLDVTELTPSNLEKLFAKFQRVDLNTNSTVEGTGLGLAITQSLLAMMGGSIEVESEYGKGSVFTVTIPQKIETIAKEIYGADGVVFAGAVQKQLHELEAQGFGNMPVCIAKTQYSLSDDQTKLGRPTGYDLNVREVYVSAGAGFVVALTGTIMAMPGLPKRPAACSIDVGEDGKITGLF